MHDFVSLGGLFLLLAGDGGCACSCHDYCRTNIQKPILFHARFLRRKGMTANWQNILLQGRLRKTPGERGGGFGGPRLPPLRASYDPRFGPTAYAVGCVVPPLRGLGVARSESLGLHT